MASFPMTQRREITFMQVRLTRLAALRWSLTLPEAVSLFVKHGVYDYIRECHGLLHVQGDLANLEDIEDYLRRRGEQL